MAQWFDVSDVPPPTPDDLARDAPSRDWGRGALWVGALVACAVFWWAVGHGLGRW